MLLINERKRQKHTIGWSWTCEFCGKITEEKYYDKTHKYRFCSRSCSNLGQMGEKNHRFKGKRRLEGYIVVYSPSHPKAFRDGEVFEHILVAEKALGHYLPKGAVVHHINGIKDDNRNCNLLICQNDNYHKRLHARIRRLEDTQSFNLKRCTKCKEIKSLTNFHLNKNNWDGHVERCQACTNQIQKVGTKNTHCRRGHPWVDNNTYTAPKGTRSCRICRNEHLRQQRERKKCLIS